MERASSLSLELTKNVNEVFDQMLKQTPDINQADLYGSTLLHVAAMYGFADKVSQLANREDVTINAINEGTFSALILAITFGHTEVVQELLKHPINKLQQCMVSNQPYI